MSNTWPDGIRHAMTQAEHAAWNSENYPGTRQICASRGGETGRTEDSPLFANADGPLCEECYDAINEIGPTGPDDCSGPDPYNAHVDDMAESRGE